MPLTPSVGSGYNSPFSSHLAGDQQGPKELHQGSPVWSVHCAGPQEPPVPSVVASSSRVFLKSLYLVK
jgi:hypothetical protein